MQPTIIFSVVVLSFFLVLGCFIPIGREQLLQLWSGCIPKLEKNYYIVVH